jgi:hypothetical protein
LFQKEENLWKTASSVKNSCGNLVLHITGGLNYHIGAQLGGTAYQRKRESEFSSQAPKAKLISEIEQLKLIVSATLTKMSEDDFVSEFPIIFDDQKQTKAYVLIQLLLHLNYHLGQINYLRRILD